MEEIGLALPANSFFEKPMLLSVVETIIFFNSDFENIRTHSKCNIETPDAGHWLHAENPELFHELVAFFSREFR
jgi:pimeloyl-ACP methyl ester carboxylesterase